MKQQDANTRLFARRMARELTIEELSAVSGAGPYCFRCVPDNVGPGGGDTQVYERD